MPILSFAKSRRLFKVKIGQRDTKFRLCDGRSDTQPQVSGFRCCDISLSLQQIFTRVVEDSYREDKTEYKSDEYSTEDDNAFRYVRSVVWRLRESYNRNKST